jgi:hypothetical protein
MELGTRGWGLGAREDRELSAEVVAFFSLIIQHFWDLAEAVVREAHPTLLHFCLLRFDFCLLTSLILPRPTLRNPTNPSNVEVARASIRSLLVTNQSCDEPECVRFQETVQPPWPGVARQDSAC